MNDRQRVELLLFVDLLQHVVEHGASDIREAQARAAIEHLQASRVAIVEGEPLAPGKLEKIVRRLARLDHAALGPHRVPGQPVAAFGLLVYVLLRELTESGYLSFAEGSPFHKAIELILPPLNAFAEVPGRLDDAERRAAIVFGVMQAEGYLPGFDPGGAA